ncbi:MAG: hypothetical protein ABIP63_03410 [Thermoanaerobaculia bacterium]
MTKLFSGRTLGRVLLLALAITVVGCAHTSQDKGLNPGTAALAACSGGGGGTPNPYAPIVCVDDSATNLPATPDPAHVVNLSAGHQPTVINWFTNSGNHTLSIFFKEKGCVVHEPECHGSHCIAVINPNAQPGKQCKYGIKLLDVNGYYTDPIVEIDACCPVP